VILYVLLAGALPFDGHSQREVFQRIATADYKLSADSNEFKLSYAARDLISKMLTLDWTKRPTVEECLVHPWISGNQALAEYDAALTLTFCASHTFQL
jgi:serine/threonine protein kinase